MASEAELLVDALMRVKIALECPQIDWIEREILTMYYIRSHSESDICSTLRLTAKDFRRMKSEALEKACIMPKRKETPKAEVAYAPENNA